MIKEILKSLRNVVRYRELVNSLNINHVRKSINSQLSQISTDLSTNEYDTKNIKERITTKHLNILQILEDIDYDLNTFKRDLATEIADLEIPYYAKSKEIYKNKLRESVEEKTDRYLFKNLLYNESFNDLLTERIALHTDCLYPGLQIAPGYGDITDKLVNCNPLYLVENTMEMFKEIKKWRQPQYQNRLRYYTVDDDQNDPMHLLPQNQLGVIVVINWFNFKTIKTIENYLKSMLHVLRPGGVVIFTYNNCDYPKAIDKVDEMYYCYTNETEVTETCTQLGYEILASYNKGYDQLDMGVSWLEIKKPGTLTTIRRSETMGIIKHLGEK